VTQPRISDLRRNMISRFGFDTLVSFRARARLTLDISAKGPASKGKRAA